MSSSTNRCGCENKQMQTRTRTIAEWCPHKCDCFFWSRLAFWSSEEMLLQSFCKSRPLPSWIDRKTLTARLGPEHSQLANSRAQTNSYLRSMKLDSRT